MVVQLVEGQMRVEGQVGGALLKTLKELQFVRIESTRLGHDFEVRLQVSDSRRRGDHGANR